MSFLTKSKKKNENNTVKLQGKTFLFINQNTLQRSEIADQYAGQIQFLLPYFIICGTSWTLF